MSINAGPHARVTLGIFVALALTVATARAQEWIGHVSAGPAAAQGLGNRSILWEVGGGGEVVSGLVAIGGEIDYIYGPEVNRTFAGGRGSSSSPPWSTIALGGTARFFLRASGHHRMQPFLSGGMGFMTADEGIPMLNFGVGVDWWLKRRTGFRFELREQLPAMLTFRFGILFR